MELETLVKELEPLAVTLFGVSTAEREQDLEVRPMITDAGPVPVKDPGVDPESPLNGASSELGEEEDAVMS